ncbi:MAG: SufE family protein [Bacteroidales bacterium]|nr:SufE family protein [Bacteroidales bacterium]MCF8404285.1 SufE family protein [Bacteroidales bacterium]
MTIKEIENTIIEEFSMFDDWMDKYNHLIEMGRSLPLIDEKHKTDQYLISGCQSRVWVFAELQDGKIIFKADSDAVITKGIANLLIRVLSGQSPEDILQTDLDFIDKIELHEHLSPTRSNGLTSMIKQMKLYAVVFQAKGAKHDKLN